jgi:hypothetical protein
MLRAPGDAARLESTDERFMETMDEVFRHHAPAEGTIEPDRRRERLVEQWTTLGRGRDGSR